MKATRIITQLLREDWKHLLIKPTAAFSETKPKDANPQNIPFIFPYKCGPQVYITPLQLALLFHHPVHSPFCPFSLMCEKLWV